MNVLRVITLATLLMGLGSSTALGNWMCWESGISSGEDFEPGARLECRIQGADEERAPSHLPKLNAERHDELKAWSLFLKELLDSFSPS